MGVLNRVRSNKVGFALIDVFEWYPPHYSKAEKKLLRKLDINILIFACLSFFAKFLDQSNITNAYVSGLKEDLGAGGNDLNYFNIAYFTAYVVGQWPLLALMTKPAMAPWVLPTLEVVWAIITFAQARVTKVWHLYLLRALLGFFAAPSFGGTHLVLGSWYRKEELFKRAGVWFTGNMIGSMFSGYLQAAAYKNLNGVDGYAGWRWLFLINGIITLPIAFIGFALFPGLVNSRKRWWFTDEEYELATTRLTKDHGQDKGITWETVKFALRRPMIWICVPGYCFMLVSSYWSSYMSLWLKGDTHFSVELINIFPTFINIIQVLSSWIGTSIAGSVNTPLLWSLQAAAVIFSTLLMTIWNIPTGLKFFAFYFAGIGGMASPIFYSWINTTLRASPAERGLVISSCMTIGYSFYIWVPLLAYPTVDAPRWKVGYPFALATSILEWGVVFFGMWYMKNRSSPEVEAVAETPEEIGYEESGDKVEEDQEQSAPDSSLEDLKTTSGILGTQTARLDAPVA